MRLMERSWILLGMMGSGKSTLGRVLCERTGREFIDTDKVLQNKLGWSIPRLFRIYGEDAFRDHETSILRSLQPGNFVVSTGGGIILREANWTEMRRLGKTIFLDVPIDILRERLLTSRKRRPLLEVDNWEETFLDILEKRRNLYLQADLIVPLPDSTAEECAEVVLTALESA